MKRITKKYEFFLHRFFKAMVIIKGADGCLDIISSIILHILSPIRKINMVPFLVHKELIEDPNDYIANYLMDMSRHFLPDTFKFITFYLAVHGIIKIATAAALMGNNPKLYKIGGAILALSIGYQTYRFTHTHSVMLLMATMVDIITIILLQHEYDKIKV